MDNLEEVPQKAVVLLDESHLQYHSRASMASESRSVGSLINLTPEAVDSDLRHSRGQAAGREHCLPDLSVGGQGAVGALAWL